LIFLRRVYLRVNGAQKWVPLFLNYKVRVRLSGLIGSIYLRLQWGLYSDKIITGGFSIGKSKCDFDMGR
jgi:hypothetical protein